MPSERLSIYIPERLLPAIGPQLADREGLSSRIAAIIDRYEQIVQTSCPPLTRAEWHLLLDACNGWASWSEAGETLMTGLALEVADHVRLNDAASKWGLTPEQAANLVARLCSSAAETMAVLERVERFWRAHELPTDEAMSVAGIVPTE